MACLAFPETFLLFLLLLLEAHLVPYFSDGFREDVFLLFKFKALGNKFLQTVNWGCEDLTRSLRNANVEVGKLYVQRCVFLREGARSQLWALLTSSQD